MVVLESDFPGNSAKAESPCLVRTELYGEDTRNPSDFPHDRVLADRKRGAN